jgi:hypothetical protein
MGPAVHVSTDKVRCSHSFQLNDFGTSRQLVTSTVLLRWGASDPLTVSVIAVLGGAGCERSGSA